MRVERRRGLVNRKVWQRLIDPKATYKMLRSLGTGTLLCALSHMGSLTCPRGLKLVGRARGPQRERFFKIPRSISSVTLKTLRQCKYYGGGQWNQDQMNAQRKFYSVKNTSVAVTKEYVYIASDKTVICGDKVNSGQPRP